jgi:hypothetical protein
LAFARPVPHHGAVTRSSIAALPTPGPAAAVWQLAEPAAVDAEIVARVAVSSGLSPGEAARVVADVLAWYREPVEAYVRRRHSYLQAHGKKNSEIFRVIAAEAAVRLVAAPDLTERQLRRIVYG